MISKVVIDIELIDSEAEYRVIASMVHAEASCIEAISSMTSQEFSQPVCQNLFDLITGIYAKGTRPTYVEVLKEGMAINLTDTPAKMDEIKHIFADHYIDDENINYWIGKVKTKAKLREADTMLRKYHLMLKSSPDADAEKLLQSVGSDFAGLSLLAEKEEFVEPEAFAKYAYDEVEARVLRYRELKDRYKDIEYFPLDGVPTGFATLDHLTLGYKPGDLIILGAQTGHGKTAFAIHASKAASVDPEKKHPILYINTEMSEKQIGLRWGATLSGLELGRLQRGSLTDTELSLAFNAYSQIHQSGFRHITIPNLTPTKLRAIGQRAKIRYGVELIILDYIGRLETYDPKYSEWQVLFELIKSMKIMAQNLECAVMVLIQLNPDGTLQGAKKMKNEADLMLKLVPQNAEQVRAFETATNAMFEPWNYLVEIDKARDTMSGIGFPIMFEKNTQRLWEARKISK